MWGLGVSNYKSLKPFPYVLPLSVNLPTLTGTSYKWKVNIPAGSNVELLVEDSTGAEAWSGVVSYSRDGK